MFLSLPMLLLFCGMTNTADAPPLTIADVPAWDWRNYKVEPFIRAAAKFQVLGKEKACALLKDLANWEKTLGQLRAQSRALGLEGKALESKTYDTFSKDVFRYEGLFILCRMLFTAKPGKTFAGPPIGAANCIAATSDKDWPLDPIEIVDGVPFLVAGGYNLGGVRGTPTQYVEYCLNNCEWNPYQFKPKTPEEQRKALEKLLATPGLKGIWPEAKEFLAAQIDRPDILIADFEGDTYRAAGRRPAPPSARGRRRGRCPARCRSSGFLGKGLVNSYLGGDDSAPARSPRRRSRSSASTSTSSSAAGSIPARRCINLLVDGKVVRTATGPNDRPGGSEHLDWHTWDVSRSRRQEGQRSRSSMTQTGGWGHINVDHIVQSDGKKAAEPASPPISPSTSATCTSRSRPARANARMKFVVDGETVREFDIELADRQAALLGLRAMSRRSRARS